MRKMLLLFVVFSAILTLSCSSSGSDDSLGSFNVASYRGKPLYRAELFAFDASDPDRELKLYGKTDSETSTYVNFNLEITELPDEETVYTSSSGLNFCEVEVDFNEDTYEGYSAEMDNYDDEDSIVTIRKSGDNYTITFSVYVGEFGTYDDHLIGSYTGPVSIIGHWTALSFLCRGSAGLRRLL